MKTKILVGFSLVLAAAAAFIGIAYRRDLVAARQRAAAGSRVVQTRCGPIEYAERGEGPPVLLVHGAGGGFDQGLMLGQPLADHGFRIIAMSRFGYLRTPLPEDASAEAQAEAHQCLLDVLGIPQAVVFGVSAGGPSATQLCLRHPRSCSAMVLLVPLAYSGKPAERLTPAAAFIVERLMGSDFLFWAAARVMPSRMIETVLGTPIDDVRRAPEAEQRKIHAMLDLILPLGPRADGLRNEGKVALALHPLPLERVTAPALLISAENCGYKTLPGARYTAERIPGARLIVYARGGHMLVGHDEELWAEVLKFLETRRG